MLDKIGSKLIHCFNIKTKGFFSFYNGLLPSIVSMASFAAVFFPYYDILKPTYLHSPWAKCLGKGRIGSRKNFIIWCHYRLFCWEYYISLWRINSQIIAGMASIPHFVLWPWHVSIKIFLFMFNRMMCNSNMRRQHLLQPLIFFYNEAFSMCQSTNVIKAYH